MKDGGGRPPSAGRGGPGGGSPGGPRGGSGGARRTPGGSGRPRPPLPPQPRPGPPREPRPAAGQPRPAQNPPQNPAQRKDGQNKDPQNRTAPTKTAQGRDVRGRDTQGRDAQGRTVPIGPGRGRPGAPPRPPARPPRPPAMLRLGDPSRRINVALVVMAFVLSLFAGRLVQLQGLDSKSFQAKAAQQRVQPETLPARRGPITDVNGYELALTSDAREIYLDPYEVRPDQRDLIATTLATELGRPKEEIAAKLAQADKRYLVVAKDVDPLRARKIMGLGFRGVGSKATYRRLYPGGSLAGGLVGFVGDEGFGLEGLEQAHNKLLSGQDGQQSIEIGRDGQRIPMTRSTRVAPVPGRELRLTIDRYIQWAAQQAIAKQVKATGARSGSVIVMDTRTGQIIAMANAPEVDLRSWQKVPAEQRGNRAASEVFEPGSTNKVITAAAALEAGVVAPQTIFTVPDHIQCADRTLRDAHPHPTEQMTYAEILGESSNVGTILAGQKITNQRLYDMFRSFGFGAKSGGALPGEEAGLLPKWQDWSGSQRCTIMYGQGISVTALQMASVYQAIANGGVRIAPTVVAGTTDQHDRLTPAPLGKSTRVISDLTAKQLTAMLEGAVSGTDGTGNAAAIDGYRVAGKTGTAMRYDQKCGGYCGYTATFVGFTPAEAPRLLALAVIQDPKKDHYGGTIAAPVFKDVMTFALKTKKIPPTGSTSALP
ncbi:cell division protein FtsI [Acrocarpospora macrocephala]|uniref:Cell division protein n=1 Tax=Acrocarpospora macrocephala TaxID=150177 RepID=A0A5M3WNA9_9ACTN|nr:cell division protein [Acrocarpospora macrocephala]